MITYFISGHLDLTREEFDRYYVPQIDKAIIEGDACFVVGDAKGADCMAQDYLWTQCKLNKITYKSITIYHMLVKPRNHIFKFATVGGYKSDKERDEAMTNASNEDIAWIRPGREKSGTAKNLKRRQ